jgi:hypothetical protein
MTTQNTFYSWKTAKTSNGFIGVAYKVTTRNTPNENGQYADTELMKKGVLSSRAKAKAFAQKWCKYLKATS